MMFKDLDVYLMEILQAANYVQLYTKEMTYEEFISDPKTTQAVILNMLIIGENSSKLLQFHPKFTQNNKDLKWESMRGMRNRIAHGYFEMNMEIVWTTTQESIPEIINKLSFLIKSNAKPNITDLDK